MKSRGKMGISGRFLLPLLIAVLTTAAVSLLFANLIKSGAVPVGWIQTTGLISVSIGACTAGMLSGTGKQGLLIGALIALIWCLWRMCTNPDSFMMINTVIEIVLCILFSWVSSCIFHKKKKGYTKRNRRASPAR